MSTTIGNALEAWHHPLCNMFNPYNPAYGVGGCDMCAGLRKELPESLNQEEMANLVGLSAALEKANGLPRLPKMVSL